MTDTDAAVARWTELLALAAAKGVDANTLASWVLLPLRRGGCGWRWWQPDRTTVELATYLRKRLEAMQ